MIISVFGRIFVYPSILVILFIKRITNCDNFGIWSSLDQSYHRSMPSTREKKTGSIILTEREKTSVRISVVIFQAFDLRETRKSGETRVTRCKGNIFHQEYHNSCSTVGRFSGGSTHATMCPPWVTGCQ